MAPLKTPRKVSFEGLNNAPRRSVGGPAPTPIRVTTESINSKGLLDYQVDSLIRLSDSLMSSWNSALDASDTGTGKTYVACAVGRQLKLPLAVLCPKSVIPSWERVAKEMGVELLFVTNYEALKGGRTKWLGFVMPESGTKKWHKRYRWTLPPCLLVFDEAHRCKGKDSQNSKMLLAAKLQGQKILLMSATAATNPLEMKAIGFTLGLHNNTNFFNWCKDHGCVAGQFGGLTFEKSERVLLNIHKQIFPNRGYRVRIKDLGDRFPESLIMPEAYDMGAQTRQIKDAYEEMQNELSALERRSANYTQQVFAVLMEARQRVELLKVPVLLELAEDAIDEGMSVAIFVNFTGTIDSLLNRTKHQASRIVGGQSPIERQQEIDLFQNDSRRLMVANVRAGGVGISLHDLHGNHPRMSLISPNYSAVDMVQALGRIWRQGAKSKALQRIVFASKTIEEAACYSVRSKLKNLSALNDGDLKSGINF